MSKQMKKVEIDGITYIPEDTANLKKAEQIEGMDYVIIRSEKAGVFAGYLETENGNVVTLKRARRIWYWDGASSLSELAMHGTAKPENCKFPCEVDRVKVFEVIEILETSEKARNSIQSVKVWSQNE